MCDFLFSVDVCCERCVNENFARFSFACSFKFNQRSPSVADFKNFSVSLDVQTQTVLVQRLIGSNACSRTDTESSSDGLINVMWSDSPINSSRPTDPYSTTNFTSVACKQRQLRVRFQLYCFAWMALGAMQRMLWWCDCLCSLGQNEMSYVWWSIGSTTNSSVTTLQWESVTGSTMNIGTTVASSRKN